MTYDEWLDELYPLEGLNTLPLSALLKAGDPVAYQLGKEEYESRGNEE